MAVLASRSIDCDQLGRPARRFAFERVIDRICDTPWHTLDRAELLRVATVYYYFSIQFRENLEVACALYPKDAALAELRRGECDTDNLSPWPEIAEPGERLDHDEFMLRLLRLEDVRFDDRLALIGRRYLDHVRALGDDARAASIASYEDGGLTRVFQAMLRAREWHGAGALAFRFFLEQHVLFDSDEGGGHGALSRHLALDDRVLPLWAAFHDLLVAAVPRFADRPARVLSESGRRSSLALLAAE